VKHVIPLLVGLALASSACSRSASRAKAPSSTGVSPNEPLNGAIHITSGSVSIGGKGNSGLIAPGVWVSEDGSEIRIASDATKVHISGTSIDIQMEDGRSVTVGDGGLQVGGIEVDGKDVTALDEDEDDEEEPLEE
jgi:hypothetical protein